MRIGSRILLLWVASFLIFSGCGKPASSRPATVAAPAKPAAAPTEPAESPDEAKAFDLYERWQAAREVKLTPEDLAALPAQAAQSARQRGEVLDLELLMGSDAKPELFARFNEISRKQIEAVQAEVDKQPKAIQDIFRSLFSGRGVRNPQVLDNSRVAFECDSNAFDPSDADQHSDVYIWDLQDGTVKCQSNGEGVDGDWACRELSAAAGGNAFTFERRFMGPREKVPKDPFKGWVWFRDGTSAMAPLSTLETWMPDAPFVMPKPTDEFYFEHPALSGDGRRMAVTAHFCGASANDPPNYDPSAPLLVLVIMDRDSKKVRALCKGDRIGPYAISRDGSTVATYGPSFWIEGDSTADQSICRLPTDGSGPQKITFPEGVKINSVNDSRPGLSADGSKLVFEAGSGPQRQVYLHDRGTGTVTLVSATPSGAPPNSCCTQPVISADGGTVAFNSLATNLLPDGKTGQIYVRDLATQTTRIASLNAEGKPCRGTCSAPSLSADGSLLAFLTTAEDMPGIRKPKKPRPGPTPARLFVIRLKDNRCVPLGGTLTP